MTIKWGDPIECNGVRPDWLRGCQPLSVDTGLGCGWMYEDVTDYAAGGPVEEWSWSHSEGEPCILRFKLPADHPAYVALARGFTPWSGGKSAPGDWDGGDVLLRDGETWPHHPTWGDCGTRSIIGYRKRIEYGAVHADGSRSGGQPSPPVIDGKFIPRMTNDEATEFANKAALDGLGHTAPCYAASGALACLKALCLIRPETTAERFTRETGHAVTEAVEAALNWKES